jgi:hypothetical protein
MQSELIASSIADYARSSWIRIGLFITNFEGGPEQRKWDTMLHGFLLQLLRSRPELRHAMKQFIRVEAEREQRWPRLDIAGIRSETEWTDLKWSTGMVRQVLVHCLRNASRPLRILVIVDGLDELENDNVAREAARFLAELTNYNGKTMEFRICVASRPEQHLLDVFVRAARIEIHHHTKEDIRRHAWSLLRQNARLCIKPEDDIRTILEPLLGYIVENATGVFLWAHTIALLANDELNRYEPVKNLHHKMEKLPKTMSGLYQRLLEQVEPKLRLKAYIALEAVLRSGATRLETLFHVVRTTELWLEERKDSRRVSNRQRFRKDVDLEDLQVFQGQLIVSCRCMMRFQDSAPWEDTFAHQRVSLVHASAREYLLRPDFLSVLFPAEGPEKPIGNGHGYHLLHARSWLKSLARPEDDWDMNCMEIVLDQGPKLEATMETDDLKVFFDILDDMDHTASAIFGRPWISCRLHQLSDDESDFETPASSFLAWTVGKGMHGYVVHRISQEGGRQALITNDNNWPLLHLTTGNLTSGRLSTGVKIRPLHPGVSEHHPSSGEILFREKTLEYLIEQGADINAVFRGRTALHYTGPRDSWQPTLRMIQFLLEHGADPDISVTSDFPEGERIRPRTVTHPLTHLLVYHAASPLSARLEVAAILHQRGAKLNAPDSGGYVLAERLYCSREDFPPDLWSWVLDSGARITHPMITNKSRLYLRLPQSLRMRSLEFEKMGGDENMEPSPQQRIGICDDIALRACEYSHAAREILRHPSFRRREWYTEEAAGLAEKMKPGWFAGGEAYLASRSRVLAGKNVED